MTASTDERIRAVLLGFRMISEGTTSAVSDSDVGHGVRHSEGRPPPRAVSEYDHWHHQLTEAATPRKRFWRLLLAEEALIRAHKAPRHLGPDNLPELSEHRTMRILNAPGSPMEVAARFRCTASHVSTLRWRDKRDPHTGTPWPDTPETKRAAALQLSAEGYTLRKIQERIGVPKSTVERYLKAG